MSFKVRRLIAEAVSEFLRPDIQHHYQYLNAIPRALELRKDKISNIPELYLKGTKAHAALQDNYQDLFHHIENLNLNDKYIKNISINKKDKIPSLIFHLNPESFIEESLSCSKDLLRPSTVKAKQIVVEFSSPNIAKPFHVGHLRSTIIGNFISNIHQTLGDNVTKLNYLGDWGTQFGLLQIGIELSGLTNEEIEKNPVQSLFNAYVKANQLAANDSKVAEKAREIFTKLETGQLDLTRWEKFRQYTVNELEKIYDRLGIKFDQYDWESQYNQKDINSVIEILHEHGLLKSQHDGIRVAEIGERRIPILKSDGSTLYLTRDIAAVLDRFVRYKFDKIFYVVDNAQTDHFKACFGIVEQLDNNLSDKMIHIKFGRISGMSTRKGNVVFLQDVLNEARDIMKQKQIESSTTKIDLTDIDDNTADILGISAVIVNDLKQRRQKDYIFVWDKALQINGDTGVKLQYTHCRLCSLMEENANIEIANSPNLNLLKEPAAQNLIIEIAKFPEVLIKAEEELESCILVNYLFSLCNATSRALKLLNIKNEPSTELQSQRMLLFNASKRVLNRGMKILGLKPLTKM